MNQTKNSFKRMVRRPAACGCALSLLLWIAPSLVGLAQIGPRPTITTQPQQSQTVTAGSTVTFTAVVSSSTTVSYQWRKDGVFFGAASASSSVTLSLTFTNVQPTNAGIYSVVVWNSSGSATSSDAKLTVNPAPPTITGQPQSQTAVAGGRVTFSVTATGSAPLSYQWRKDGGNIAAANGATYTITNVQVGHAGGYSVVVSNALGSTTSVTATLTVLVPPTIIIQPTSRTVAAGGSVTFSVTATGTAPLRYQWRKADANITGATNTVYTISNVQIAHADSYTVLVSNTAGSATSSAATLTVNEPPSLTIQPKDQTAVVGATVTFSVTAAGTAPLNYQWRKAVGNIGGVTNTNIAGATNAVYTISNVQVTHAGSYTVLVSNTAGSVTSSAANLTVLVGPFVSIQPRNLTNEIVLNLKWRAGDTVIIETTGSLSAPLSWTPIGTNRFDADALVFKPPVDTRPQSRFYRARLAP